MLKYILSLTILVGCLSASSQAQTPLLQALIDATPAGGTLTLPSDVIYPCNCVIRQSITIESNGAKIVTPNADPAINILPGVRDVTLRGLDISAMGFVHDIVRIGEDGPEQDTLEEVPTNITLDRLLIHGSPTDDSQRGVSANGANVTITNSRIYEIHGRGYDTQAIGVWNGPGPFKIIGNYLEGAGENVMFGGALATIPGLIPSNIEIRNNHFFKPLSWKVGDPSYAGFHWSIKNLLEFKNAQNVVVDSNLFENSWTDAQDGYGILFTVRGEGNNQMPWATIQNVEFTNNIVRNCDNGIQTLGLDYSNASTQASGLRVYNNYFEGIKRWFFLLGGYHNVTIEHTTHFQGHNIVVLTGNPSPGFVYRNNATIRDPNGYGFKADNGGEGTSALDQYSSGWVFEGNVIAGALEGLYPIGNFFPADLSNLSAFKGTDGLIPGYLGSAPSTPVPSPSPVPTSEPTPTPTPSADGTKDVTITDNNGGVWTLGANQETLRNSAHMSAGYGTVYKWLNATVYVSGMDGNWYQWASGGWMDVGPVEPGTSEPSPSPTPSPTPTPAPSPSPTPEPTPSPSPSPTPCKRLPNGKCKKS